MPKRGVCEETPAHLVDPRHGIDNAAVVGQIPLRKRSPRPQEVQRAGVQVSHEHSHGKP